MPQSSRVYTNKDLDTNRSFPYSQSRTFTNRDLKSDVNPPDIMDDGDLTNDVMDSPPDIMDDESTEQPRNIQAVSENEPDTWMEGFKNSFTSGEAFNTVMGGAKGFLKGSIDIPATIKGLYEAAKAKYNDEGDGITNENELKNELTNRLSKPMGNPLDAMTAGSNPEEFGHEMGMTFGQPLLTYGMMKGAPSAIRTVGKVVEPTGRFMKNYTPLSTATGAAVGGATGGIPGAMLGTMRPFTRPLRFMERKIGKGMESIGNKMQNVGIKSPLEGEYVGESSLTEGEIIKPIKSMKVIRKELPPSKVDHYASQSNPKSFIDSLDEEMQLQEGQELTVKPQPKLPKMRRNQNGTFTNLDTGEIVNAKGESIIEINGKPVSKQMLNDMKDSKFFNKNRQ